MVAGRRVKSGIITKDRLSSTDDYRYQLIPGDKFEVALILNAVSEKIGAASSESLKKDMAAAAGGYLRRHATDVLARDILFTSGLIEFVNEHIDDPTLRIEAFAWLRGLGFRV